MSAGSEIIDTQVNATLVELGSRVRAWRARRGMTRKALAADSGLSERFLADVEGGKGNVSINSLEAAARALNITVIDLLQDAPRPALARAQGLVKLRIVKPRQQALRARQCRARGVLQQVNHRDVQCARCGFERVDRHIAFAALNVSQKTLA